MSSKHPLRIALALGAAAFFSPRALALDCHEIMNMVNVNVPTRIVVQTMEDSGERFAPEAIRCLINEGAPDEVVAAARKLAAAEQEQVHAPVEHEVTRPSRRDAYEQEPEIGAGRRSRRDAYRELPEEGEQVQHGACADRVQEAVDALRARKPLGSSKMLFDIIAGGQCPQQASKAHYYLARALFELKMYHSAQHYFMQVVRKGPANPYFKYALPKLVAIARYTGDNTELLRIVPHIPPDEYPRQAKNTLYYLMGVRLYEKGELTEARKYFSQISTRSSLYLKSKYYEGVIYNQQGRLKSAVRAFRDVIRDSEGIDIFSQRDLSEVDDLTDLAMLDIARIYYRIQRFDEASKYFGMVPRGSNWWPEALFEQAWSTFMQNDLNRTLGLILTVRSPFYQGQEFIPEAQYLRALTFFNLCEYDEVEQELLDYEGRLQPIYDELKAFTEKYRGEGRKLADQAYDAWFEQTPRETALTPAIFRRFLRNKDLTALTRHLDMMSDEESRIDAQKALWRDSVGEHLKQVLAHDRERLKRRAGLVLLQEMARAGTYVGDLLTQSEIVRFEVVSAQRADYAYKMSNPDLIDVTSQLDLDFATSVDFIYWPFNGEFWKDELGYYRYTEQGSCK